MRADNEENAPDIASSAEQYAGRFSGLLGLYLLERQEQVLNRMLETLSPALLDVLDVGGGHLQTSRLLAAKGHAVVVHGSTADCLRRVPALANVHEGRVRARIGSIFDLPAAAGEFDLVLSFRMLAHVSRWRALLREMCRTSHRFVLVEFASTSGMQRLSRLLFSLKRRLEGDTRHYATYSVRDIAEELGKNGFRVIAVDRQFTLPIIVHRILQRPALSRRAEEWLERAGITSRIGSPALLLAERRSPAAAQRAD
jgi:SAM-dependent methyltransferase